MVSVTDHRWADEGEGDADAGVRTGLAGAAAGVLLGAARWAGWIAAGAAVNAAALVGAVWASEREPASERGPLRVEVVSVTELSEPEPEREPVLRAGDERSAAESEAWLGGLEAQDHQAASEAEVDQAQLTREPSASPAPSEAASSAPAGDPRPSPFEAQHERTVAMPFRGESATDTDDAAMARSEGLAEVAAEAGGADAASEAGELAVGPGVAEAAASAMDGASADPTAGGSPSAIAEADDEAPRPDAAEAGAEAVSGAQAASASDPGAASEAEADAAARVPVAEVRDLTKPVVGAGLRVMPQRGRALARHDRPFLRPKRNPVVTLHFRANGTVRLVEFGRDGRTGEVLSTGDARVDAWLVDMLYLWRAQGEALGALGEGQSLPWTVRVVLF